jgi:hypothetical protein
MNTKDLIGRGAFVALVAASSALAVSSFAQSNPPAPDDHGSHSHGLAVSLDEAVRMDSGAPGSGRVIASAARGDDGLRSSGEEEGWGVLTYEARDGDLCLAAGTLRNGKVGTVGPNGFRALRVEESPGNCGDLTANLRDLGGVAMISAAPVEPGAKERTAVVYGVLAPNAKTVTLRMADGARTPLPVQPAAGVPHVAAAFAAPVDLGADQDPAGTGIEIEKDDGSVESLDF